MVAGSSMRSTYQRAYQFQLHSSLKERQVPLAMNGARGLAKQFGRPAQTKPLGASAYALLGVPVLTFGLGYWQVKRKEQKEMLIAALNERLDAPPIPLPTDPTEMDTLQYRKVSVEGEFDHELEIQLGPRTLLREAFDGNAGEPGMHIISPFTRSDNGQRILVNRGWVPLGRSDSGFREDAQVKGKVSLNGIVTNSKDKKANAFIPDNEPEKGRWYWVDINAMADAMNTAPILIDAAKGETPPSGLPVSGQTQITIRNEHMQYIITWFGLSACTLGMWFVKFRPFLRKAI